MFEAFFSLNWIDFLILFVIFFYAIEGFSQGFYLALLDLISFITAFVLALSLYFLPANLLIKFFLIPQGLAKAIGFFIIAFLTEVIINLFFKIFAKTTLFKNLTKHSVHKTINSLLGILPGIFSAILLTAFILTMIITLPISAHLKRTVSQSKIGSNLVTRTQGLGKDINNVFGGAINEGIAFFTIEPQSSELVNLNFTQDKLNIDKTAEEQMFLMVNSERKKKNLNELVFDELLTKVGREHCQDMFQRGYFSHNTPEGTTPFNRMAMKDISFTSAGENLALSPNVNLAMEGLMKSKGHKKNILSEDFGKIGIGVIDGGIYGEMFCQEFTN